jgi:ABC-type amino acid transport substrate-binding protein
MPVRQLEHLDIVFKAHEIVGRHESGIGKRDIDGEYLDVPVEVFEVNKRETALKMVGAGRMDYFLDGYDELVVAMEDCPDLSGDMVIQRIKNLNIYMCFQNNSRGQELADLWDRRFQELMDSGEMAALFAKWYPAEWFEKVFE